MGIWTLLPPLVALLMVWRTREVVSSLLVALFCSEALQRIGAGDWQPFAMAEQAIARQLAVFESAGNTRLLLFALTVGALLALIRAGRGAEALVARLNRSGIANTPRRASLLTLVTSAVLFIESNLSVLVSGLLSRPLFDRHRLGRARLAYFLHSFSPPICILVLFNGWGAYVLGLITPYDLGAPPVQVLAGTVPLNFYALVTVLIVITTAVTGRVFGPMARSVANEAESRADTSDTATSAEDAGAAAKPGKVRYMVLPLLLLVGSMFALMFVTGGGNFMQGDGSRAVLYAVLIATLGGYLLLRWDRVLNHEQAMETIFAGMKDILPITAILAVSIALGASLKVLGTGQFVASMVGDTVPLVLIVPLLFLCGAVMSFATGTSWGTFALLVPIGMPLVGALGLPPSLVLAAILGGGVFGDHCSPISDTTVVSSMASGCDLFEHVRTQLPYALVGALIATVLYLLASVWMLG